MKVWGGRWEASHPDVPHAERRCRRAELFERHGPSEETAQLYLRAVGRQPARRVLCAARFMDVIRVADEPTPGLDLIPCPR